MKMSLIKIIFVFIITTLISVPTYAKSTCLKKGVDLLNAKRSQKALEVLNTCTENSISDYILFYKVKALLDLKRSNEAIAIIEKILKKYPKFPMKRDLRRMEALAHLNVGHAYHAAIILKKYIVKRRCGSFDDYILLVEALYKSGRGSESRKYLDRAIKKISSVSDWREVVSLMKVVDLRLTPEIGAQASDAMYVHGNWNKAGELAKYYLKKWPNSYHLKLIVGKVAYRHGDLDEAIQIFSQIKNHATGGLRDTAASWLSSTYGKQDDFEKAIAIKRELHKRSKGENRWKLRYQIAYLYMDAGKYNEAIIEWKKLLTARGRGAWSYRAKARWGLGWSYFQQGRLEAARSAWLLLRSHKREFINIGETKVDYWIARTLEEQGFKDKADNIYQKIVDDIDYYGWLAKFRLSRKKFYKVPWPKSSYSKCNEPNFPSNTRWNELVGVDEALRAELKQLITPAGVKMAQETELYDVSYRLGRDLLMDYLEFPVVDGFSCLAWNAIYLRPYRKLINGITDGVLRSTIVWSVMMSESAFRPYVESPVGARGLMQIMPDTAKEIAKDLGVKGELNLFDPEVNIPIGTAYLMELANKFPIHQAVASYNAGENAVKRWLKRRSKWEYDRFIEEIPYKETRGYVKKVLARAWNYTKLGY